MSKYKSTLALLDQLIAKLEANTGGEPLLPSELHTPPAPKVEAPVQPPPLPPVKPIPQPPEAVEKKEGGKKAKGEGKKLAVKAEPEKPKLPEGVDPDVLVFAEVDLRVSEIV